MIKNLTSIEGKFDVVSVWLQAIIISDYFRWINTTNINKGTKRSPTSTNATIITKLSAGRDVSSFLSFRNRRRHRYGFVLFRPGL